MELNPCPFCGNTMEHYTISFKRDGQEKKRKKMQSPYGTGGLTMYDELIKRLRDAAKMSEALTVLLPHSEGNATAKLFNEAADAIEELVRKEKFHAFLWNVIQPNEMEQYLAMYRAHNDPNCVATDGGKTDER